MLLEMLLIGKMSLFRHNWNGQTIMDMLSMGTKKAIDDVPVMLVFAAVNYIESNTRGLVPPIGNPMLETLIRNTICAGFEVWKLQLWMVQQ